MGKMNKTNIFFSIFFIVLCLTLNTSMGLPTNVAEKDANNESTAMVSIIPLKN